ncbi:hypothetical protein PG997_001467 [Apiospora hydei]|uniref:Uncharacterized protein n=1 Tax=Apiospora hydei TaxID=1337664 RepID=A0ABR1XDM5_9PEZI
MTSIACASSFFFFQTWAVGSHYTESLCRNIGTGSIRRAVPSPIKMRLRPVETNQRTDSRRLLSVSFAFESHSTSVKATAPDQPPPQTRYGFSASIQSLKLAPPARILLWKIREGPQKAPVTKTPNATLGFAATVLIVSYQSTLPQPNLWNFWNLDPSKQQLKLQVDGTGTSAAAALG